MEQLQLWRRRDRASEGAHSTSTTMKNGFAATVLTFQCGVNSTQSNLCSHAALNKAVGAADFANASPKNHWK